MSSAKKDWSKATLSDLADNIVATHHQLMRVQTARVRELFAEMQKAGAIRCPGYWELKSLYKQFEDEIVFHLLKEEQMLFPLIKRLEGQQAQESASQGRTIEDIRKLLATLEGEHESGNLALEKIRVMTTGFVAPSEASEQTRQLYAALKTIAQDMVEHVYKEDRIMFPRVVGMMEVAR